MITDNYVKLFNSILTSTIWLERNETRLLWITMLALSNKDGVVNASVPGLASIAKISLEDTRNALDVLMSPDEHSRTKDFDGRRIEPIDGGWVLLNHAKYRRLMSRVERAEYNRLKQRESRAKKKDATAPRRFTPAELDTLHRNGAPADEVRKAAKASGIDWVPEY